MSGEGLKTAVDLVMDAQNAHPGVAYQGAPEPEPEQIDLEDLLGLPRRVAPADSGPEPERRGPGRPPGSRNRRTVQWAEYLLRRYASPLEVLAQMATSPIADLVQSLGCTALEAFQEKRQAAIALAPFLHQRQPLALHVTERKLVYLTITTAPPDGPAIDGSAVTLQAQLIPPEPDSPTGSQDEASD